MGWKMALLGTVEFNNPLLWAVVVGWIISVILHEFAHGLAGYLGGDYTIRERGGLSLNPIQYVDPIFSILLPVVILLVGGLPLPGGATYIRRDLLRGKFWDSAVSLAGPAMNLLIFLGCALPLHPAFGWVAPRQSMDTASRLQVFLGAMAVLQFLTVVLNLIPVPPLDGFQAIAPYLPRETRLKLSTPPLSTWLFFGYFLFIWQVPGFIQFVARLLMGALWILGFDMSSVYFIVDSYQLALWGHA